MVVTSAYNKEYAKRCYWIDKDGRLTLCSANPAYQDFALEFANVRWTGVVLMFVRGDI